jgi:hypothetical protein
MIEETKEKKLPDFESKMTLGHSGAERKLRTS